MRRSNISRTKPASDMPRTIHRFAPAPPEFPMGTGYLDSDIMAGILTGGGPTLAVGAAAAMLTMVIGITLGALSGYYGGWVDDILMRVTEFLQVLPALLFFCHGLGHIIFALSVDHRNRNRCRKLAANRALDPG